MREKFAVTKSASSAKKYRCRPAELMRSLKRAAHKRQRRAAKYGKEFVQVSSWDIC